LPQCPRKYPEDDWEDDPTSWPGLTYFNLYHYLIKTPSKISVMIIHAFFYIVIMYYVFQMLQYMKKIIYIA